MPPPKPAPSPAVTKDFSLVGTEDTSQVLTLQNFQSGYQQNGGSPLNAVRIESLPVNGTIKLAGVPVTAGAIVSKIQLQAGDLTFQPNSNLNDQSATFTFGFTAADSGGVFISPPHVASVSVAAVNDAPILDNTGAPTLTAINEDVASSANPGTPVSGILGVSVSDPDAGAVAGIAVTGLDTANGSWQYSLDGGTSYSGFGAVSGTSATLLTASALMRFLPNANYNGTATISYQAWDTTSGSNGASGVDVSVSGAATAFSTASETASLTINAVNDAPVGAASSGLVDFVRAGNVGAAPVIIDGGIAFSDVDAVNFAGGQLTVQVSQNNTSTDVLGVNHQGTGIGQISVAGATVSYTDGAGTKIIGTTAGGAGTTPMTIALTSNASPAALNALARNITFDNTLANINPANDVVVAFTLDDGAGGASTSTPVSRTIDVRANSVDVHNGAMQFDGVNDSISVGGLNIAASSFSIEFWSRRESDTNYDIAIGQGTAATNNGLHIGWRDGANNSVFTFGFYGNNDLDFNNGTSGVGEWISWSVTYDATTNNRIIYKNGVHVAQDTATADYGGTGALLIGESPAVGSSKFNGMLDEVRIWNGVRTAAEVQANYQQQIDGAAPAQLVAYYRFDDESMVGTVQNLGSGGNTHDGTVTGAQVVNTLGRAINFDGVNDVLNLVDGNTFDTASYTIETWVKLDATNDRTIIARTDVNGFQTSYSNALLTDSSGKFVHYTYGGGASTLTGNTTAVAGQWYHLAAVYDAATNSQKLYVNGMLDGIKTGVSAIWTAGDRYQSGPGGNIGTLGFGLNKFNGQMGELRIWGDARTDQEIVDNYNQILTGTPSGLLGHYTFEETSGASVPDVAGSVNGTLTGNPTWVNAAPTVFGTEITVQENQSTVGNMSANELTGAVTYSVQTGANNGTATIDADGDWHYTPTANFYGTDTFTLRAVGATHGDDSETISVTVNRVDHASVNVNGGTLALDGVNDHVLVANNIALNNANWTIESWFKTAAHTAAGDVNIGRIVSKAQGTGGNQYSLYMSQGKIFVATNTISTTILSTASTFNDDQWHHASGVYDGNTLKLYVDGNLVQSAAVTGTPTLDTKNMFIGSYDGTQQFFDGQVEEVRVWASARTAAEVRDNYDQQLTGSETGLAAYYRFDDDNADTVVRDQTSNKNDGTLTNGAGIVPNLGQALKFDGVNDFVDLGTDAAFATGTSSFTVETWVKAATTGARQAIFGSGSGDATNNGAYLFIDANGKLKFDLAFVPGPTSTATVADGLWHHVAVSNTAGTVQLYVDGIASGGAQAMSPNISTGVATIGTDPSNHSANMLNGSLSDLRFWDTARTAAEITDNFQQTLTGSETGLVVNYTMDEVVGGQIIDNAGTAQNGTLGASTTTGADDPTLTNTAPTVLGTQITTTQDQNASGTMSANDVTGTATYYVLNGSAQAASLTTGNGGVVTIDPSSGAWIYDPAPTFAGTETFVLRATDGVRTDDETITVTVRDDDLVNVHGAALQFDGVNDHVTIGTVPGISGAYTVEAWVNAAETGSWARILDLGQGENNNNIIFGFDGPTGNFHLGNRIGATATGISTTTALPLNQWVHVAAVNNGDGTGAIYYNGIAQGLSGNTATLGAGSGQTLTSNFIGRSNWATDALLKGQVDEVRVWTTARSADQIRDNMDQKITSNDTGLLLNYHFDDDPQGVTVADSAGTAQNGTVYGSARVLSLDGVGDFLEVGNPSAIDMAASMSVEAWVKTSAGTLQTIVGKNAAGNLAAGGKQLSIGADGKLAFSAHNIATSVGTTVINDGVWHHVALTITEGGTADVVKLYVDGGLETISLGPGAGTTSSTYNLDADAAGALLRIGRLSDDHTQYFDGQIDDVRFWSDVRTQPEIQANMHTTLRGNEAGLNRYFDFDRDLGTIVDDKVSGVVGNNATLNGNASISADPNSHVTADGGSNFINNLGGALNFDGTTTYINAGRGGSNELAITGDVTVETWLKLGSTAATQGIVDFANVGNVDATSNALYQFEVLAGGNLSYTHEVSAGVSETVNFTNNLTIGQWYHVAFTRNVTTNLVKVYVNGAAAGSFNYTGDPTGGSNSTLIIGGTGAGAALGENKFNGQMSDLRVWNTARTDAEIADNYNHELSGNQGGNLVLNYKFNETAGSALTDSSGTITGQAVTGTTTWVDTAPNVYGTTVSMMENDTTSGKFEADAPSFALSSAATNGTATIDAATGVWNYTPNADFAGTDSFTLLAAGAGSETITVTVNNRDQASNIVADGVAMFDGGLVDRIQTSTGTGTITNQVTFEMDVLFDDLTGQQNFLGYKGETNNQVFNLYKDATNHLVFNVNGTSADSGVVVSADTWYHVTGTYDGSTANIYVNGDLKAIASVAGVNLNANAQNLVLGGNPLADATLAQGVDFKGMMDEVRVWSDVRTATEIRDNYQNQITATGNNLEVYYRFDGNSSDAAIVDQSGHNRHGSTANGQVLTLDGIDDHVTSNLGTGVLTNTFTMEAWVKQNARNGIDLATNIVGGANKAALQIYADGRFDVWANASNTSSAVVPLGKWTHLAATFDGTNLNMYMNGELVLTSVASAGFNFGNVAETLYIGRNASAVNLFDGQIDDVRIWSDVRTQAEIREHMHQTLAGSEGALIANYTFDDDVTAGGAVDNSQGLASRDGTLTNGATVTASPGSPVESGPELIHLPNKALLLDGVNDNISLPNVGVTFQDMTVETWINLKSLPADGGFGMLLGNTNFVAAGDLHLEFQSTAGIKQLLWGENGNAVTFSHDFAGDTGKWMHISVVRDVSANQLHLYLDGTLAETVTYTSDSAITLDDARIGALGGSSRFLDGQLSDFRIWSSARTGLDVQHSYNQTLTGSQGGDLVINYVMDEVVGTTLTDSAGSNSAGTVGGGAGVISVAPVVYGNSMTISEGGTATGTMTNTDVQGVANYAISSSPAVGSVSIDASSGQWTYTPPENYAGTVSFGVRASGATSGTDTETVSVTVTANAENAVHGGAIQLDGVNDTLLVNATGNLSFGTGDFTVEAWVNLDQAGINQAIIDNRGGVNLQGFLLGVNASNNLQIGFSDGANSTAVSHAGTTTLAVDTWYHVAATFSRNGTATMYVNGVAEGTPVSIAGETGSVGSQAIHIGSESSVSGTNFTNFKGMVDEVRFWNVARTAQEIGDNFNELVDPSTPNLAANYRFDEVSGGVVQDATANDHDAQVTVDSTGGAPANILNLSGATDYLSISNDVLNNRAAGTIESWLYLNANSAETITAKQHDGVNTTGLFSVGDSFASNAGKLSFRPANGTVAYGTATVPTGQWVHVAVTFDSAQAQFYINGVLDSTTAGNFSIPNIGGGISAIGSLITGSGSHGTSDLDGKMDEVRIWSDVRTATEIQSHMNEHLSGAHANLVANYSFDADNTGNSGTVDNSEGTAAYDATRVNGASVESDPSTPLNSLAGSISGPTGNVLNVTDGAGTADQMSASLVDGTITNAITMETWVRFDRANLQENFMSLWTGSGNNPRYVMVKQADGSLQFFFSDDVSSGGALATAANLATTGGWHHVAMTYDNATAKIFMDGVEVASQAQAGFSLNTGIAQTLTVGTDQGGFPFDGQLDNVRVWNSAHTVEQIRAGMTQSYDYDTAGLVSQYTFDDVAGTSVRDNSAVQANGTLANGATITDSGYGDAQTVHHLGNALNFSGVNDVVAFGNAVGPTGSAERTIMMWARTGSDASQQLVSYGTATTGGAFGIGFNSWENSGGGKGVTVDVHGSAITFQPSTATNDGQWHHYAVVVPASAPDGTVSLRDLAVYQDGHLLNTVSGLAANNDLAINTGSGNLTFGSYIDGTDDFNGHMTEVSIWSKALTTAQIHDYMNKSLGGNETGLSGYWKLDEGSGTSVQDSSSNNHGGTITGANWISDAPDIQGGHLDIAQGTSASGQMTSTDVTGAASYTAVGHPANGTLDVDPTSGHWTYTPDATYQGTDSFVIRASGATSGVDNETVSVNVGKDPTHSTDHSLSFDGVNDVVSVSNVSNMGTTALSVELWMKTTGTSETMFSYAVASTAHEALFQTSGTTLSFTVNNTTGASLANAGVTDGAWHHVAATYDGTATKLYVDGSLKITGTGATGPLTAGGTVTLGQAQGSVGGGFVQADAFAGEMNDVRVWDTVRTDTEISANYDKQLNGNETGLTGYWQFNEGAGAIADDSSSNANDGAITDGASYVDLSTIAITQGETYKGMILGSDADGDGLSYNLSGLAGGTGSITASGNTFTYVNNNASATDDSFNVTVTDDHGHHTTDSISLVVS